MGSKADKREVGRCALAFQCMRLAIVGGGLAGLAAAYEAEQLSRGEGLELEIVIYEAADRLGGKLHTSREDGFVIEHGADAMVRYKPWAVDLCGELGIDSQLVDTLPADPAALIFARGQLAPLPRGLNVAIPSDLRSLMQSRLLTPAGKARALADLVLPRRSVGGDEALGELVTRRLGRELWQNLAAPLVGGIYGGDPASLSTQATFPQLLELEQQERSLILGSRRLLKRRALSRERGTLFASLAGGLGDLVEAIVNSLQSSKLRTGTPVESLNELDADAVVLAIPAFSCATILADRVPEAAALLREIDYLDSTSITMAFKAESLNGLPGHGLLFAAGDRGTVRGFTWVDRKWGGRAPAGAALIRAFLSAEAGDLDDEQVVERALQALGRAGIEPGAPERVWITRWPKGMPRYALGHPERVGRIERALTNVPGVFAAGSAYRGVGVPDVVRDGRESARRAVALLTSRRQDRRPSRG